MQKKKKNENFINVSVYLAIVKPTGDTILKSFVFQELFMESNFLHFICIYHVNNTKRFPIIMSMSGKNLMCEGVAATTTLILPEIFTAEMNPQNAFSIFQLSIIHCLPTKFCITYCCEIPLQ